MVHTLSETSRSSNVDYNLSQECQSSTMISTLSLKSKSLTIPVPRLIVYRLVHITPVSDNPPSFSWLAFAGVSDYIVQLSDSKGIVWRDKVHATKEQTVTYCNETFLEPGKDYIFTVEIDRQYSCVNSQGKKEVNIADDVKKGIENIEKTGLPKQFVTSIIAQLDGLLIAREEILNIVQGATRQGSHSEIICFLNDFLAQGSAFQLLADERSSDDILDALAEIASQLAAANVTLGEYLQLSGVQKSLALNLVKKGADLAFFAQDLAGAFQLTQFANALASNRCDEDCPPYPVRCTGRWYHKCGGCPECDPSNT